MRLLDIFGASIIQLIFKHWIFLTRRNQHFLNTYFFKVYFFNADKTVLNETLIFTLKSNFITPKIKPLCFKIENINTSVAKKVEFFEP